MCSFYYFLYQGKVGCWTAVRIRETTRLPLRVVKKEYAHEIPAWDEYASLTSCIASDLAMVVASGAKKKTKVRTPAPKATPTELPVMPPVPTTTKPKGTGESTARVDTVVNKEKKKKTLERQAKSSEEVSETSGASSDTAHGRAEKDGGRKRKVTVGRSSSDRKHKRNKHSRRKDGDFKRKNRRSDTDSEHGRSPSAPPAPPGLDPKATEALVAKLSGDVMKLVKTQVDSELKRLTPAPSKGDESAVKAVCTRVSDALGDGLPNAQMEARISQLVRDALAQYATDQAAQRAFFTSQLARMEASLATVVTAATDAAAAATAAAQDAAASRRAAAAAAENATEHGEQAMSVAIDARTIAEAAVAAVSQNSGGGGSRIFHGTGSVRSGRRNSHNSRSRSRSRATSRQRSRSRDRRTR